MTTTHDAPTAESGKKPGFTAGLSPTQIDPLNVAEMKIVWSDGQAFALSYIELRFHCPCASCVDEHTGKRTLQREQVATSVRPLGVEPVGRYAVQIGWSDQHATGIYHFDRLRELCEKIGQKIS